MLTELVSREWIAERMEEAGYSDVELASIVGVSPKAVEMWRKGARNPSLRSAEALLEAFGYRLEVRDV